MIILDIETAPAPDDVLERVKPEFKAPANYKDEAKIKLTIAEAEATWRERAALDAKTGQVIAIGLLDTYEMEESPLRILTGPEQAVIGAFWTAWADGPKIVGFCIKSFDLPFLVQRSWILGVPVPTDLLEGRYWNRRILDLQEIWTCFSHRIEGQSLDAICRCLGIGGKSGNGKDFARLFREDRPAAEAYLSRDLELCAELAKRLGIS